MLFLLASGLAGLAGYMPLHNRKRREQGAAVNRRCGEATESCPALALPGWRSM